MHTSFPKGTPLRIKLKTGQLLTGKFFDHKSGKVILEGGQNINLSEVKSMSIRKLKTSTEPRAKKKIIFRTDQQ